MNSAFNEFPHERTEFSDQTYAAIGRALAYATAFEAICRSLSSIPEARQAMSLASESEPDADAAFGKAVEAVWGKRLREHVGRIFEQYQLAGDVASIIQRAKGARNEMAHEVALGISHFAESETDQSQLFTRLSELTSTIAQGFLHVELITLLETNEPIPSLGFLEAYPDRVAEWVREALIDGA